MTHGLGAQNQQSPNQVQSKLIELIDDQQFKEGIWPPRNVKRCRLSRPLGGCASESCRCHYGAIAPLLRPGSELAGPANAYRLLAALENIEWDENRKLYVDNFLAFYVDKRSFQRNPEREKAGKWNIRLVFEYALNPERAIARTYADDILDGGTKSKERPHYGVQALLYPPVLNQANTPRMWQAKRDVVAKLGGRRTSSSYGQQAWAATDAVLGMVLAGQSLMVSTLPEATMPKGQLFGGGGKPSEPIHRARPTW